MKRFLSMLLCVVLLLLPLCLSANAISINRGYSALLAQFKDGATSRGEDYVYFSPVKNSSDSKKYPLFIWLHGAGSGLEKRAQIAWYDICNYVSDEYQARFTQGGCFILAPRDQGRLMSSWEANDTASLKRVIDEFINKQKSHIDTKRIYICGYSTGASMVWNMAAAYPNFFAAVIPGSALLQPSTATVNALRDVSVWIFCCDRDPYPTSITAAARSTFNAVKSVTRRPEGVRITVFSQAVFPDGSKKQENGTTAWDAEHYSWLAITNDMHMYDGRVYLYQTTTDATGKKITFPSTGGFISWLNNQKRNTDASSDGGVRQNIFESVFAYIRSFFIRIFSIVRSLFQFV